ncbi:MAG: hypothetical protein R3E03_05910 [Novosphingobium sp.]
MESGAPPGGLGESADPLRLATVHDAAEVALADRAGADGMFLSPVFPPARTPAQPASARRDFMPWRRRQNAR